FAFAHTLHKGKPQAAIGAGAFEDGTRNLSSHFTEEIQIMAVVLDVADVHFGEPGAECGGVNEQADIHAIIVLKAELAEQFLARGDDAAERLLETHQFGEVSAKKRAGGQHGHAARPARKAGLYEIRFATQD